MPLTESQRRTRAAYRAKNREKIRAWKRANYRMKKGRILAQNKQRYEDNRERILAQQKERYDKVGREKAKQYRLDHPASEEEKDAARKRAKAYYWNNRTEVRQKERLRYQQNPEAWHEASRRRKLKVAGLEGGHTVAEWRALCAKFHHRCVCCGVKDKLTRDHVIPITRDGATDLIENIQPLCQTCNSKKHNTVALDYRKTPFCNKGQAVLFT